MRLVLIALPVVAGLAGAAFFGLRDRSCPVESSAAAAASASAPSNARTRRVLARGQLGPGRGTLLVSVEPPRGAKLTAGAPLVVEARGEHLGFPKRIRTPLDPAKLPLRVPIDVTDGASGPAHVDLSFYWCTEGKDAACRPERVELVVDLDLTGDAAGGEALVTYRAAS